MINLLHADFFKLRKSLALKVCFLATTLCAVILAIVSHGVAIGDMNMTANNASGLSDIFIMSVVGPLMAGIIICADFESKDIHDAISCGRLSIVISKAITFVVAVSILVLPYALVALFGFANGREYSELFGFSTYTALLANSSNYEMNSNTIFKAIRLLLTSIVLYAGRLSICIPIAFKVRKPVVVTVIGVVFGFVVDFLVNSVREIQILGDLIDYTPFSHILIKMEQSNGFYVKIVLISFACILFMTGITYAMFKKSEIK